MSFSWPETLSSREFRKSHQLPFANTCISTLWFHEASHPYLWLWGGPHSDPHCKGLNSYHSQEFLGPQGFIGFRAILSHFIPSIWFKCFITNSWLFLRRRERTGEVKQHLSLKQENMLVCISCQIWGTLAGSWWFGHISDFRVNFTELYCLPLDPHWRTRCQAYLRNCTCDQSAALLGTSQVLPLHCVVSFTPSVLLERHAESSAAFYSQRWGVNGMKEPDVTSVPLPGSHCLFVVIVISMSFLYCAILLIYRKFTRVVQSSCISPCQPPPLLASYITVVHFPP